MPRQRLRSIPRESATQRIGIIGSYFNIPVAYLPEHRVLAQQEIDFFGMRYVVPVVAQWPGTVIAVNLGGAVIPTAMSLYLPTRHRLWVEAALATAVVAAVCYWLSRPIPGLGIAEPVFVPSLPQQSWRCCSPASEQRRSHILAAA
jgi:uncharacterized membrane protein